MTTRSKIFGAVALGLLVAGGAVADASAASVANTSVAKTTIGKSHVSKSHIGTTRIVAATRPIAAKKSVTIVHRAHQPRHLVRLLPGHRLAPRVHLAEAFATRKVVKTTVVR